MVHQASKSTSQLQNPSNGYHTPRPSSPTKATPASYDKENFDSKPNGDNALQDYRLGDCLGKGAFGSVYRALHWGTGETVAIKKIKLVDLPPNELKVIMLEIDLLKNLHHPNIVKYHGFRKTSEALYIILEYCENGSLHSICKKFGKFPENLVALYVSQVLKGLLYLHEQGVIHRDIKGANILLTKEGLVKLADFGVATKASGLHEHSVVGTPYWMAPEVIELSGATTASDIWSLGCTIIELIDGKPPYHKLQPMPALFRIVNDDHPPLPESTSPHVQDFLTQCFQKDPNLRVTAKKLLKHTWISGAKKIDSVIPVQTTQYDVAVKTVQQWNEALKSPEASSALHDAHAGSTSPSSIRLSHEALVLSPDVTSKRSAKAKGRNLDPNAFRSPDLGESDNWDDDFASSISSSALQLPHLRPVDNFDGRLSPEKLKKFASFGRKDSIGNYDASASSEQSTWRQALDFGRSDPMETVRPQSPAKIDVQTSRKAPARPLSRRVPAHPRTRTTEGSTRSIQTPARPRPIRRSSSYFRDDPVEDYSDLIASDEVALDQKFQQVLKQQAQRAKIDTRSPRHLASSPSRVGKGPAHARDSSGDALNLRTLSELSSPLEIHKYAERIEDEDFSDIFTTDGTALTGLDSESGSDRDVRSMLTSKFSTASGRGDDEDEDDPFAQLEESFDEMDLETKVARDRHARLCTLTENLVASLKTSQPEEVLDGISDQLLQVLCDAPDMKSVIIASHGLLPILEVLEHSEESQIILTLLRIINMIILDSVEIQENFCFVGGIPIVTKFAKKKYASEIRFEAAIFVRQMYQTSTLTLQMFISCGGLNVLVEFLEEDYDAEHDLVLIGVTGVWSVFSLQGPTPKNDFCRILSRSSVLYPLSLVLNRVLDEDGDLAEKVEGRIANIFLLFSQAENHVKESVADRMVLKRVLKDLRKMTAVHQITMLKFIKNLSMLTATLDALQNSNAIEHLTDLLSSSMDKPHFREISNQILNTLFNLCRLSKPRQEDAALNGVVPLLQKIVELKVPLKEFALPILCDMASSGKVGRKILWQNKGLNFYISLLSDSKSYWQVTALEAIFIWLQEETAKVEEHLRHSSFKQAIVACFINTEGNVFENLLEPLQKLLRLSPPLANQLAQQDLFEDAVGKLQNKKAVVRGNILRIIRSICDAAAANGQPGLIRKFGLLHSVQRLAESDPAILVRNMASELLKTCDNGIQSGLENGRYRVQRRTSSSTMMPSPHYSGSSQPPTPSHSRASQSSGYFDIAADYSVPRARGTATPLSSTPIQTANREVGKSTPEPTNGGPGLVSSGTKSRLPRTSMMPSTKTSKAGISRREELGGAAATPSVAAPVSRTNLVSSPRRRRQTSGGT